MSPAQIGIVAGAVVFSLVVVALLWLTTPLPSRKPKKPIGTCPWCGREIYQGEMYVRFGRNDRCCMTCAGRALLWVLQRMAEEGELNGPQ